MVYVLVPVMFCAGLVTARWFDKRKRAKTSHAGSFCDVAEIEPTQVSEGEVASDLRMTRNSLSALLQSLEECEGKLTGKTIEQDAGLVQNELLHAMQSAQELLAVSYDHLRRVKVPNGGVEGRDDLNEWLARRLALLIRYGNSVSIGVVQFRRDSNNGALTGDRAQDLTQVMVDFVRDTDRLFVYSENEFVVGLPETGLEEACLFAARCRQTMRKQFGLDARVGITEAFADDNGRTVLKRADAALHHSLTDAKSPLFSHDGNALMPISEETPLDRLINA